MPKNVNISQVLPIILIGPMATGKSTVAQALAKELGLRQVPMDKVRFYYYFKKGFSLEKQNSISEFSEVIKYWKPYEVDAVREIIKDFPDAVIDFGAGHSYYQDENQFKEVESVLSPLPNVFLILPCLDKENALSICNQRLKERKGGKALSVDEEESNRAFIYHPCNEQLAKHTITNEGKTPEQVAKEIGKLLI